MSRPAEFQSANVAIGKCRDRQMSRPAKMSRPSTGKCRDRQKSDRQKSDRRGVSRQEQLKYNSFDVYHMKCNFPQKWTVYELSAIQKMWSGSKKSVFGKSVQKTGLFQKSTFFESLITQKRFIFKNSYISYGKRKKSYTLNVIYTIWLYLACIPNL